MRTTLCICAAILGVMAHGVVVAGQDAAVRLAGMQQHPAAWGSSFSAEEHCVLFAHRLIARARPQKIADVTRADVKLLSDEICAE